MPLCAVVKADAYGHGAIRCARVFAQEGAAWLAVSRLTEALELRRAGLGLPILILGRTDPRFAGVLARQRITQCCYSLPYALALSERASAAGCRWTSTSRPTPAWAGSALPSGPALTPPSRRC